MVTFETGEFEIAIATYNRPEFVAEWLERCYEQTRKRGIHLSIYDSSTNDETENYIRKFKACRNDADVEYCRVDSDVTIGYKSMLPLLHSASKYVWVSGDSRCQDFDLLDMKVFPYLKQDVDCVILHATNNEENDGKVYTDKNEFLHDCFVSMTCLGLSIYKTIMFEPLKRDSKLKAQCDQKYQDNYAFGWIGYFLEMYALREYKAVFAVVPVINIKSDKKVASWFKKYYGCVIGDLCDLMDTVSDKYQCTEKVIRDTWKYLSHDIPTLCYETRKKGDLNPETYRKYKENGMLDRCTRKGDRLKRFAYASDGEVEEVLKREQEIEKKEFETLCRQNLERIKGLSENKELWIYGAGTGGKILAECLTEQNISVCGFVDKKAESIISCEGMPVRKPDDIDPANCFIVISLLLWKPFIVSALLERGIERKRIFYISIDCD